MHAPATKCSKYWTVFCQVKALMLAEVKALELNKAKTDATKNRNHPQKGICIPHDLLVFSLCAYVHVDVYGWMTNICTRIMHN